MSRGDGWSVWKAEVVAELGRAKLVGATFEQAWRMAVTAHPPRQMEQGPRVPHLDDEVTVVDFFREACADAWHGRRDELRDLPAALEGGLTRNWPTVGGRGGPFG